MNRAPLRILFVTHGFPPEFRGGTEFYCERAARALLDRGHHVELVTGTAEARDEPRVVTSDHHGLVVHRLHRVGLFLDNWDRSYAPEVEELLRDVLGRVKPDLVHVHHWVRLTRTLVATCHDAGVPAVATVHDLWTSCPRCFRVREDGFCTRPLSVESCLHCVPRDPWLADKEVAGELELFKEDFRQELRLARRVVAPSRAQADLVAETTGVDPHKVVVLRHGTIAPGRPDAAGPGETEGRIHLGHWGWLTPMKGVHLILEALRALPPELADRVRLHLWGDTLDAGYAERLSELAQGLDVVRYGRYEPGDLRGVPLHWAVIPSLAHESHSFVLDEAFAMGVPVLAAERGALAERVGGAGFLFRPEDAGSLGAVLARVLQDPGLREGCRRAIPGLTPMEAHAQRLEVLYWDALTGGGELPRPDPALARRRRMYRVYRQAESYRHLLESRGREEHQQARAEDMARTVRDAEASVEAAREMVATYEVSIAEHRVEKERREKDLEAVQGRLQETGSQLADLAEQLRAAHEHAGELEQACERAGEGLELYGGTVARLDAERRDLLRSLEEVREECRRLEGDLERARAAGRRAAELQAEADDQRSRLEELRQQAAAAASTAAERGRELAELRRGGRRLQELLQDTRREARRLKAEQQSLRRALAGSRERLQDLAAERDRLEAARAAERGELDALRRREEARRRSLLHRLADRLRPLRAARSGERGLKILMVVHQYLPRHAAGTEIYAHRLATELSERNRVHLLFTEARYGVHQYHVRRGRYEGLPFTEICHQHDIRSFRRTWDDPRMRRLFEAVLDRERPDVVHFQHLMYFSLDCVQAARSRGIPVVLTLHEYMLLCPRGGQMRRADGELCTKPVPDRCADCIGHYSLGDPEEEDQRVARRSRLLRFVPRPVRRLLRGIAGPAPVPPEAPGPAGHASRSRAVAERLEHVRAALGEADLLISPSRFLRERFLESGMVQEDRIIVSDNGLDPALFCGVPPRPSTTLRAGYIGTIAEYKGTHVLLRAMEHLGGLQDLECHIHGSLDTFPDYARQLQRGCRDPRVRFHGRYDNRRVGEVLAGLDVLVVPSLWYENSPLTIHEAFMAGVPVVASRLGGMAEYVEEGVNGLLFRPGDAEDLARTLERLHKDRALLGRLAVKTPVKSIQEDGRDMERRYRELLARRRAPPEAVEAAG